jgi:hypothetical protein
MVGSGVGGPGGIEFRKAMHEKFTNTSCRLRNRLNLSHVDGVVRRIQRSGHHHSLSFIFLCSGLVIREWRVELLWSSSSPTKHFGALICN